VPNARSIFYEIAQRLIEQETRLPPEPEPDTIEHARWRDRRNQISALDTDRMYAALDTAFKYLPITEGDVQVPLGDIADREHITRSLIHDLVDKDLFPILYKRVVENYKSKEPYFKGTPLEAVFNLQVGISIPEETRFAGTWIVAPSGTGKTTLLNYLLWHDLTKSASIVLMDSKGELIDPLKRFDVMDYRLVIIEPHMPLALNPFAHGQVHILEYLLSSLMDAKLTAKQANLFRFCIQATLLHPNPSMPTFRKIMSNGVDFPVPPELEQFFKNNFPTKVYAETRQEIEWRLQLLLNNTPIGKMLTASTSKLDIGKLMDEEKVVVINNSKAVLGDDGAEFFGRMFLALILAAAQKRSLQKGEKTPCYVYIDEAQSVIRRDEKIATILDECRSQKIARILAHQRCNQLNPDVLDAVANSAVRYANSDDDAAQLASKFRVTADKLRSLRTGEFQCYVRNLGSFKVKVPYFAPFEQMTDEQYAQVLSDMRQYYQDEHTETLTSKLQHTAHKPDPPSTDASKDW